VTANGKVHDAAPPTVTPSVVRETESVARATVKVSRVEYATAKGDLVDRVTVKAPPGEYVTAKVRDVAHLMAKVPHVDYARAKVRRADRATAKEDLSRNSAFPSCRPSTPTAITRFRPRKSGTHPPHCCPSIKTPTAS
jgi:hypothetical protein